MLVDPHTRSGEPSDEVLECGGLARILHDVTQAEEVDVGTGEVLEVRQFDRIGVFGEVGRPEHLVDHGGVGLLGGEHVGDVGERDVHLFDVVLGEPDGVERPQDEPVLVGARRPRDLLALEVLE